MPFSQYCGAIYLRSKSYLVFEISSDIMTKHCCQVCVLSMMFCRSDSRLCWPSWHGKSLSDGAIAKTWVPRGLTLRRANAGNDMENILYVWFSHFTLTETHRWWIYSLSLYFNKNKNSPVFCWPISVLATTSKPSLLKIVGGIAVEQSKMMLKSIHIIANENSYHDDKLTKQCFTRVFCPQLISNMRSRRRIDSSSIIAHPVNFDEHLWTISTNSGRYR